MEKILGNSLDNIISGDTMETQTYRDRSKETGSLYVRNVYIAEDDGIVLLENETIPYKEGDLLISFEYWGKGCDSVKKVVNTSTTDLSKVFADLKLKDETI